jgi:hypothetical protein
MDHAVAGLDVRQEHLRVVDEHVAVLDPDGHVQAERGGGGFEACDIAA